MIFLFQIELYLLKKLLNSLYLSILKLYKYSAYLKKFQVENKLYNY